jgi:hypothetical protein
MNRSHTYLVHAPGQCPEDRHCSICDGGLSLCTVCHGAEGTLPAECPGVKMTDEQQRAVYAGEINFTNGEWTRQFRAKTA